MNNCDLLVIGAGPGGYRTAEHAARLGLKVTIVEAAECGGTCLNRGCIPTKTLCHEADVLDAVRSSVPEAKVDFAHVRSRLDQVVGTLRQGVEGLMQLPGITLVKGSARFTAPKEVEVNGETYSATNIIIATGSAPKLPPIEGLAESGAMTSDELLQIDHVPAHLVIVGAGVIGMEFASVFSRFGAKVSVVEFLKECLPALDSDIAKRLRKVMERQGIDFYLQAGVKRVANGSVTFERKGKETTLEADAILIATGRKARIEGLGLEAAGIETDRRGIVTDDEFRTNVEGVYAIGDVNGRQLLAHAATMQGLHVVNQICGKADTIRLDIMPAAIFTHPEAACVGLTEDQCKEQVPGFECRKAFHRSNGKALSMNETEGMLKLLSAPDGRIIGCHAFGAHSADMVQEVSALMTLGTTVAQLRDMVHIHPTLSELVQAAAES